jgi:hypothetical protein
MTALLPPTGAGAKDMPKKLERRETSEDFLRGKNPRIGNIPQLSS